MNFNDYNTHKLSFKSLEDYKIIMTYSTVIQKKYIPDNLIKLSFNLTDLYRLNYSNTNIIKIKFTKDYKITEKYTDMNNCIFFNLNNSIDNIINKNLINEQPLNEKNIHLTPEDINILFNFK
jgi:hypothetical protein